VKELTIDDFELTENGIPQRIEAVYLIKKKSIERSDEKKKFSPETSRNFFLFFEAAEYIPKIGKAIEYFMENVIYPGDNLMIVTPMKSYKLKADALRLKSKEDISREVKGLIRKDTWTGNAEYRNTLKEIESLVKTMTSLMAGPDNPASPSGTLQLDALSAEEPIADLGLGFYLTQYASMLSKLETLRRVDQLKLLDFASYLKNKEGQKYVYMFYQREFIPKIDPKILTQYTSLYQEEMDVVMKLSGLFEFFKRDITFDVDLVKKAYADAMTSIHFLFISKPAEPLSGIRFEEHSEDIFAAFGEMARATGGFIDSSANPEYSFKKAVEASENYYLLYYTPKNYIPDGKFRTIKVSVKDKDMRIIHRVGYFGN
jgi:hypothetical protein